MHLRSRNLPRPSASSPPGNRSHPMANPAQAPDLEGLHREVHDMAEQMRIMNENNGRLMQLLAAANPPLPAAAAPLIPEVERSCHSNRSGNRSRNISADQAILEVEDPSDKVIIMAMMEGLRPGPLFDSLSKNVPETLSALQSKADKYIAAEELAEAKRRRRGKDDHKRKEPDTRRNDYREETRYKRPDRDPKRSNNRHPRTPPRRPEFILPTHSQRPCRPNCPSPYNAILGRLTLGGIKAITSTYHLKMKFPTSTGIGETPEKLRIPNLSKKFVPISIHPNFPDRQVMIGTELTDELRIALIDFLKKNSDVFAWTQGDVPGIDPEVAMHKLFTKPEYSPVRQKRRKFAPERLKVIEDEVNKLIKANLKEYLGSPPLLSVPTADEDLYVYLSASPIAISAVLVREEDKIQKLIYYVSKTLIGAEVRYPRIEKIAYALMIAARKLRHYFQAHSIIVLTDQPLKQILQRPDTSGRLLKWSIELSEFHIEYKPRTAIKAQALADFIVESTYEDTPQPETTPLEEEIPKEPAQEKDLAHWILFIDGSSNQHGCGAGLVIRAPSGEQMEYAIRMGFKATNNEAEYEAPPRRTKSSYRVGRTIFGSLQ
ncbi:hypothetical protein Acr_07g0011760 [Actinidia rufa]|uniref:Reverse transcriptase RNase H-like domain-containing protein n=1 Tax=Actinidia rufa TaxID=165716 RepID=A0A7J0EX63_9ERIC|nr:hypothetical protein Acr_07g0011760 [Actinidia rufa]